MWIKFFAVAATVGSLSHCKTRNAERDADAKQATSTSDAEPAKENFRRDFGSRKEIPFDSEVIRKIERPIANKKGEGWIQDPVISALAVTRALEDLKENLTNNGVKKIDMAYEVEMAFGLNQHTNSLALNDDWTFGTVKDGDGKDFKLGTSFNCFACHSGRVGTQWVPGRGNPRIDLRRYLGEVFSYMNPQLFLELMQVYWRAQSSMFGEGQETFTLLTDFFLMGDMWGFMSNVDNQTRTAGTTDPWGFAVQLFKWRTDEMNYKKGFVGRDFDMKPMTLDPMPWWNLRYKNYINSDGIIAKGPRTVVQASFSPGKTGKGIRDMDPFYREIFEAADRYSPPVFPNLNKLDLNRVVRGEQIFNEKGCSSCHGTYSQNGIYNRDPEEFKKTYKEVESITPVKEIGTDPQRLDHLNFTYVKQLEKSWLTDFRKDPKLRFNYYFMDKNYLAALNKPGESFYESDTIDEHSENFHKERIGYVSPPLWGLWASAPYLHNGSVPTLSQFLKIGINGQFTYELPSRNPYWWLANSSIPETPYDVESEIGLKVATYGDKSGEPRNPAAKYDTTKGDGRSNLGHEKQFGGLTVEDRRDLLEYLKTL